MKLPLSWLKEYVEVNISVKELAEKLVGCGFEVEDIIYKGKDIENVVVGKILSIEKHPDADRLSVCQIDVGASAPLQVVTGASNVSAGNFVPVALCGAKLKGGLTIKEGKLRGADSYGMLCSGAELGIDDSDYEGASVNGILILKGAQTCGEDVKRVLGLDEYILDISLTANRNDCQGIYGMAREVAARLSKPLKPLNLNYRECGDSINNYIDVEVTDKQLCPRYIARCVKDIKFVETPDWMKKRLRLCGIRPINIIVDITNYVLLETGQPMHAFDARFVGGKKIVVRRARQNEKITTLDGKENILTGQMLIICDADKPIAVAGIMGGEYSGIMQDTAVTIFEAAKFARDSIRKTSRALNLRSDSSARFERGVDSYTTKIASERALALVCQTGCGVVVGGTKDILSETRNLSEISVAKQKIDDILGIDVPKKTMTDILNALEFKAEFDGDVLHCQIPQFRIDIEGYPDLAEEIIRYYGYDKLQPTLLADASITEGGKAKNHLITDEIKLILTAQGFNEIITYTFINQNAFDKLNITADSPLRNTIKLLNPLSEEMAVMRTLTAHSMLETVAFNLSKKNNSARLFEIGAAFFKKAGSELPYENQRLCISCYGKDEDFFTIKGSVDNLLEQLGIDAGIERGNQPFMHGGRCANVYIGGKYAGFYGELHPDAAENYDIKQRVYLCELDFDMIIGAYKGFKEYVNIPKFPQIERDLAVVVSEDITCRQVLQAISAAGGTLLKKAELFDYYKGGQIEKGFVSMAFSLTIGDDDKTLKVEDADKVVDDILAALENKYSAKLR